jgi:hypothetical protein
MSRSCPAPTRALRQCAQIADLGWPRSVDTIEPDRLHLGMHPRTLPRSRGRYSRGAALGGGPAVSRQGTQSRGRYPDYASGCISAAACSLLLRFQIPVRRPPIPAMPTIDKPGSRADEPPLRLARPDCSRSSPSNRPGWWLLWFVDERRCVPRLALSIREMMAGERHWRG